MSVTIPRRIYEIALSGSVESCLSAGSDMLLRAGVAWQDIVSFSGADISKVSVFVEGVQKKRKIESALKPLVQSSGLQLQIIAMAPNDWFHKWKNTYRRLNVGGWEIVPKWLQNIKDATLAKKIVIDPGSAFGTGLHETTQLMLRSLEGINRRSFSFLDLGTGSGILSVAARGMGARQILAVDHEKEAMNAARTNLPTERGCQIRFIKKNIYKLALEGSFDLVAANLTENVLLDIQAQLAKWVAPAGDLLVSGILKNRARQFKNQFRPGQLRYVGSLLGRDWVAYRLKKRAAR